MDYNSFSKEQLIQVVEEMKILNQQLLDEREQEIGLNFSWSGNLGHWYWNIVSNKVTFNSLKITTLGYTKEEIPENVTYQYFTDKLHPDDYQKTMDAMLAHLYNKAPVYEIEYRIKTKDGNYKWYYDRGKITQFDANGKPLLLAGIVFDITEKKEMQMKLEYSNLILAEQSSTDGLTKLKNHRALIENLKDNMAVSRRLNEPLSIAIFDIDDFKRINDSKGHLYGDKVLVDLANIMQKSVRNSDFVGRYGGEEFMVIFPRTNIKEAVAISDRIRSSIEHFSFIEGMHVTISGGVKELYGDGMSLSDFVHAADLNLYEAKKRGKNVIV